MLVVDAGIGAEKAEGGCSGKLWRAAGVIAPAMLGRAEEKAF